MFVCNVLPPCIATLGAIIVVLTVSPAMAGVLVVIAAILIVTLFHLADAGKPLHHNFADKAAAVDGEMVDVIAKCLWCGPSAASAASTADSTRPLATR